MMRVRSKEIQRPVPTIRQTPCRHRSPIVLLVTVLLAAGTVAHGVEDPAPETRGIQKPRLVHGFSMSQSLLLSRSLGLASRRLRDEAACRELFEDLDTDGIRTLKATIYQLVRTSESSPCQKRGVAATTRIGRPRTNLCPAFLELSPQGQATTLLHEALHHAGLSEHPIDPDAMTSYEITKLVRDACRL